jgi:hypothetical protein
VQHSCDNEWLSSSVTLYNGAELNQESLTCDGTWQYASDLYLAWDSSGTTFSFTIQLIGLESGALYLDDITFGGL